MADQPITDEMKKKEEARQLAVKQMQGVLAKLQKGSSGLKNDAAKLEKSLQAEKDE